MGLFLTIVLIVICLAVEVFFSGAEIALVVSDKVKIKARAECNVAGAEAAMWFIRHPAHFFSTVILGTNISVVLASTIATFYLISNYGENAEGWALLLSPVVLIFGEVLPKSLFQHYSSKIIERISTPLMASMYIMLPLVWSLSKFTNFLLGGVQHHVGSEPRMTHEELALLISSSEPSDFKPSERKMISKILNLAHSHVENVMVPLALVESISVTSSREKALEIFDLKGFSKLPIFENRSYNVIGMLDCLDCIFSEGANIRDLLTPVIYIPKGMRLQKLYLLMREKREQHAIVVDEYGAAAGLVTLEDILEEIVGDIRDEYELGRQHWRKLGENHYLISGRTETEEMLDELHIAIPKGPYETLAGYLLHEFGTIPRIGESIRLGNWKYIIKRSTEKAIIEVEVIAL